MATPSHPPNQPPDQDSTPRSSAAEPAGMNRPRDRQHSLGSSSLTNQRAGEGGEGDRQQARVSSSLKNKTAGAGPRYYKPQVATIEERESDGRQTGMRDNDNFSGSSNTPARDIYNDPVTQNGAGRGGQEERLTVDEEWKVERELKKRTGEQNGGVRVLALVKWLVTCLMMLALLACLISAKMAVLTLSKQLHNATAALSKENPPSEAWRDYSAQFIVLYFLLSAAPLINVVRAAWYGLFDKTVPWPSKSAILLSVLRAFLETVGLCVLVYGVLGRYDSPLSLLLTATPLLVPAIGTLMRAWRGRRRGDNDISGTGLLFMAGGVVLCGMAVIASAVLLGMQHDVADVWRPVVAFVLLSLAWLPSFQERISSMSRQEDTLSPGVYTRLQEDSYDSRSYGTFSGETNDTLQSTPDSGIASQSGAGLSGTHDTTLHNGTTSERGGTTGRGRGVPWCDYTTMIARSGATWKAAFIVHACRLVFTFVVSALLFILDSPGGPSKVLTGTVHDAFLEAWTFANVTGRSTWTALGVGLSTGLVGYVLAFGACHMNMMRGALTPPLVLATPLSVLAVSVKPVCEGLLGGKDSTCTANWEHDREIWSLVAGAAVFFLLAHLLTFRYSLWRSSPVLLQQESVIFWLPGYNAPALDTWLLLNRRDVSSSVPSRRRRRKNKVYICTTMYREEEDEMRQLLESINEINKAQAAGQCCFESHIILDGGVRGRELSEFSLTLIGLLQDTLGVEPEMCTKTVTPYGLKLSWRLPGGQMDFSIHLKDNQIVKNKKRWSQVMYMSYVLDFVTEARDEDNFILTTDADVVFTPDSVEALLDLMSRDHSIGAVCARTHPMGDGPLVWYQKFEYAIGHWFQKTAEHVLGSVLCAPGCFSVYRCRALADVLPKYARRVETAFDFLTKDMGEDRWLCTLMVQCGWRIEYCATSENHTNCPSHFDEFYKQRRRWIASTIANLMLIVKEWKYVRKLNQRVSNVFLLYQVLLLCSTLIGPSTIVLIVSGGMVYAWNMNGVLAVMLQLVTSVTFALICVYATQRVQLTAAKIYTFLYAVAMTTVTVGTAVQIVNDLSPDTPNPTPANTTTPKPIYSELLLAPTTLRPNQHISIDVPISVTTIYFAGLAAIFLVTAMLHPGEFGCLLHGIWYLLCLPSGYLVLPIYSVCNITDSSWGTREEQQESHAVRTVPWYQHLQKLFRHICFCCVRGQEEVTVPPSTRDSETQASTTPVLEDPTPSPRHRPDSSAAEGHNELGADYTDVNRPPEGSLPDTVPVPVEQWLPAELRSQYAALFRKHGYDNTLFLAGMTEGEMREIGVRSKGHLHSLVERVQHIPAFDIQWKVPTNVDEWLDEIGLPMYKDNFRRNRIQEPKEMEILKTFRTRDIENELGITKKGHAKRLKYAISALRNPTEGQQKATRMRQVIDNVYTHYLRESSRGEYDFWERLRQRCLEPDLKAFGLDSEVKAKLAGLRNDWLLILAVSNTLWLILITTLASEGSLTVIGANPVGLAFLVVFGVLFVIQFLSMLQHRLATLSHFLARAPYRCGSPLQTAWSFRADPNNFEDTADRAAIEQLRRDKEAAGQRVRSGSSRRHVQSAAMATRNRSETTPLIV